MVRTVLLGAVVALFGGLASAQFTTPEVDRDAVIRMGNSVIHSGGGHKDDGEIAFGEVMGPPADDNHKWFISVITSRNCQHCERLKADLHKSQYLRAFCNLDDQKTSWAHTNVYLAGDKSQDWRWKDLRIGGYPTILIQPPLNKQFGDPSTVVLQHTGYDGNDKKLAEKMSAYIRAYIKKLSETPRQNWEHSSAIRQATYSRSRGFGQSADVGLDPPWTPRPKVEPSPAPTPFAPPFLPPVNVPVFPDTPPVGPQPGPVSPDANPVESPDPEAIIVTSPSTNESVEKNAKIQEFIVKLREREPKLRVRTVDFADAKERFPVNKNDLPAVFVLADGQIVDKVSGGLLPFVLPTQDPTTLADFPVTAVLALLTSGFAIGPMIVIGIWAFKYIRTLRKNAGQTPVIDDNTAKAIETLLPGLLEKAIERFLKKPSPKK
jgi:hypothetical protein